MSGTPTGRTPAPCQPWCDSVCLAGDMKHRPGDHWWRHDRLTLCYCSPACRDAGRALNQVAPTTGSTTGGASGIVDIATTLVALCPHGFVASGGNCSHCQRAMLTSLRAELAAYKKAKAENDERFMTERDEARADLAAALKREGEARADLANADALAKELQDEAKETRERATRLEGWLGIARTALKHMETYGGNMGNPALIAERALDDMNEPAPVPTAEAAKETAK